jgi:hypothetical protein
VKTRFRMGKETRPNVFPSSRGQFESVSKGAVELGNFECRQGGNKVSELTLEHQCKEIAADGGGPWQSIFWSEHDLRCESEDFSVNGGADHGRDIFVLRDKGAGYNDVKAWLCSTLGNPFAGSIDFPAPHERACSVMSTRAWRARRLRCLRNTSPSLASVSRRRWRSAYWRKAVRISAVRLRRRDDVLVSSSRSFEVASSMAIVFIPLIISAVSDYAQGLRSVPPARADKVIR